VTISTGTREPDEAGADDLIDALEVARILGLAHRNSVSTYRSRYRTFPQGQRSPGQGRARVWRRGDILAWREAAQVQRAEGGRAGGARLDELVAAAGRLLLAHPAEEISIRQIAAEAGVAHSDLYRYATSKEELLQLGVVKVVEEYQMSVPEDYDELLARMEQLYEAVVARAPWARLIAAQAVRNPDQSPRGPIPIVRISETIAARREAEGIDSPVSAEVLAACLGSITLGLVVLGSRWKGELGVQEYPADQVAHVLRAIARL